MQITGVPETISREKYLGLIRELGFEFHHLLKLEFTSKGIYAEQRALDENGNPFITRDGDGNRVATHKVFVRIEDEDQS